MVETTAQSYDMEVDRMFRLLSNGRRRNILRQLIEQHPPVTVEELVESVVRVEPNGDARSDDRRDAVLVSLHHNHLPKLANANVIDLDTEREWVTVRMAAYAFKPYLELSRSDERREYW